MSNTDIAAVMTEAIRNTAPSASTEHREELVYPPEGLGRVSLKIWYKDNIGYLPVNWMERIGIVPKRKSMFSLANKESADESHSPNISEVTRNIPPEITFDIDAESISSTVELNCQTASSQLRHRADMLRRRATEMDEMADAIDRASSLYTQGITTLEGQLAQISMMLEAHAHIEPTKIKEDG